MSKLTLNEDWTAGIGGGLWSTGVAMAKYFERPEVVERLRGKRCLELGSGNGFLGAVLASTVDDCTVTVTDTEVSNRCVVCEDVLASGPLLPLRSPVTNTPINTPYHILHTIPHVGAPGADEKDSGGKQEVHREL
jgi:hypothetical protein